MSTEIIFSRYVSIVSSSCVIANHCLISLIFKRFDGMKFSGKREFSDINKFLIFSDFHFNLIFIYIFFFNENFILY
jgi:hypothetical protein